MDKLNHEWLRYEKHTEARREYNSIKHDEYHQTLKERLLKAKKLYEKYKHTMPPVEYNVTHIDVYGKSKSTKRKKSNT